ncbi:hypothetical protein ACVGV2_14680 [Bounagaea algeriensis]
MLAAACGAGCGVAAALWWHESLTFALVLAVAAFVVGLLVLLAQGRYIAAQRPDRPASAAPGGAHAASRRHGTRPDLPADSEAPAHPAPRTRQDVPAEPTRTDDGATRAASGGTTASEPTRRADEPRRGDR